MTRAWAGLAAFPLLSLGLMAAPQPLSALDCSASPLDGKSAWVYRTVEGRKCWYRGTQVIPRSELRWADADKPEGREAESRETEVRNAQASLVPAAPPAEAAPLPAPNNDERHPAMFEVKVDQADTFEARWRGWPR